MFRVRERGWQLFCERIGIGSDVVNEGFGAAESLKLAGILLRNYHESEGDVKKAAERLRPDEEIKLKTAACWRDEYYDLYETFLGRRTVN